MLPGNRQLDDSGRIGEIMESRPLLMNGGSSGRAWKATSMESRQEFWAVPTISGRAKNFGSRQEFRDWPWEFRVALRIPGGVKNFRSRQEFLDWLWEFQIVPRISGRAKNFRFGPENSGSRQEFRAVPKIPCRAKNSEFGPENFESWVEELDKDVTTRILVVQQVHRWKNGRARGLESDFEERLIYGKSNEEEAQESLGVAFVEVTQEGTLFWQTM